MLLPATVALYCIRLSTVTDMLYYYCRRLATRCIFTPCRSLFGVNHLIVFEMNRIISRIHSWFACRFFFFLSPLLRSSYFSFSSCRLHLHKSYVFSTRKRKRKTGVRTLDPWSGNLLCWRLDHATPLSNIQCHTPPQQCKLVQTNLSLLRVGILFRKRFNLVNIKDKSYWCHVAKWLD